jgi:predicted nuclease of predicted toxin-antitoxin system
LSRKILADECVDFRIVRKLRAYGFDVISVLEECPSIPDRDVLKLAKTHQAILLTEDHHFGRWVFAHKQKEVGIIFLRYSPDDLQKILYSLVHVLNTYQDTLSRKFVVIKPKKIRIRDV